jgi:hypothetical protein
LGSNCDIPVNYLKRWVKKEGPFMAVPKNQFVYMKVKQDFKNCEVDIVRQAVNEVLDQLTTQINSENRAPSEEQLDRISSALIGLSELITEKENRGIL